MLVALTGIIIAMLGVLATYSVNKITDWKFKYGVMASSQTAKELFFCCCFHVKTCDACVFILKHVFLAALVVPPHLRLLLVLVCV